MESNKKKWQKPSLSSFFARFKKTPQPKGVPTYKLFSHSDLIDKALLFIGVLSALASGGLFPVAFLYYGEIAGTFVDYETSKKNITLNVTRCFSPTITNKNHDQRITSSINGFLIIAFVSGLANYLSNVCFNTAAERQIKRLRQTLFESILRQDMAFFDKSNPGELNSVLTNNLETLKGVINFKFSDCLTQVGKGIACIIFALVTAWKFTLPFLTIVPFMVISLNLMIHYIKKYSIQEFLSYGSAGKIAQETLSSLRTTISFGIHHKAIKEYGIQLKSAEKVSIKKGYLKGFFEGAFNGLLNLMFGIGIYYATILYRTDCKNYYPGNLMPAFFCLVTSSVGLGQGFPFLTDVGTATGVAKKIFDYIKLKSSIDIMKTEGKIKLDQIKGDISLKNVFFSYPQRPDVKIMQGLNLDIPAGKTVAFCGASGCGKSTIVGLLQRFYLPTLGEIRIDGHLIENLELSWLRSQMALVSQEPTLFTTSIKENIRMGRLDATDEEIKTAAKNANAHEFIIKLSDKYDTIVGERGVSLSGGQKQRIAIARALIRNPKILLLDEATSALDNQSERIVQDALDKAKLGRTTIIIAHRLTTIRNADLIVGFEGGKVKEKGTHEELMKTKGIYYELVNRQSLNGGKKNSEDQEEQACDEDETFLNEKSDKKAVEMLKKPADPPQMVQVKSHKQFSFFSLERKLFRLQRQELKWNVIGTLAQLINGAIFPGIVLIFSEIYNIFLIEDEAAQTRKSLEFMAIIIALGVTSFFALLTCNYSHALSGAKLTKRIRENMFKSMLRQEIAFHDEDSNRSSILVTKLATNPPFCKGLSTDKIGILSQGLSGIGFAIVVAFVINWKLSFIMLIFVPVNFFAGVWAGQSNLGISSSKKTSKGRYSVEEGGRILIESVENIRTVVSLGLEKHFITEMKTIFEHGFRTTLISLHLQAFFYTISNTLLFFIQITAFTYGWFLIKNDGLAVANLYKVYAVMTFSSLILGRVYALLPDQKKARDSTVTAFRIIERKSAIDSMSNDGEKPRTVVGDIEFKNVCFEYPTRPGVKVLDNFSLRIQNGEATALVGQSGCGKSTTVALLLRFYDVTKGCIELDGVDIRKLNIEWLRGQIGIVSQEPALFDYSIMENVVNGNLANTNVVYLQQDTPSKYKKEYSAETRQLVRLACTDSNIDARIESLPEKYETVVGQKGSQLSGGEKQRIAIARALIRKPTILLLDEATSALDTQSEFVVQDALDKAQKGRTCIVIAHRLSTIENSSKICVVRAGQVAEYGTHVELMQLKGSYYRLQNPSYREKGNRKGEE